MEEMRKRKFKREHMAHGNVQKRNRKTDGHDQPSLHRVALLLLLPPVFLLLGLYIFLLRQRAGAESGLLHLPHNHLRSDFRLVVGDGHLVRRQIHVTRLHTFQFSRDPFHRTAAGCTGHAFNIVNFSSHKIILSHIPL